MKVQTEEWQHCDSRLLFVKLSKNLKYIGESVFESYNSLASIFIPPSCSEIGRKTFSWCRKLIIFHVPQDTTLGLEVIGGTALSRASPFDTDTNGQYEEGNEQLNEWIRNRQVDDQFSLNQACASLIH